MTPDINLLNPYIRSHSCVERVDAAQATAENIDELRKWSRFEWLEIGNWILTRNGVITSWCTDDYFQNQSGFERIVLPEIQRTDDVQACPRCGAPGPLETVISNELAAGFMRHTCDPYELAEHARKTLRLNPDVRGTRTTESAGDVNA